MFFIILMYALFASVFTVSKLALQCAQPLFLIGTRMTVAGILMLAFSWVKYGSFSISRKAKIKLLLLAFFNIYLANVCEFWGLQHLTTFKASFLYSLAPFLSALVSYLYLKQGLSVKKWAGLFVGFLGFIPILISQTTEEELAGKIFIFSWPEVYMIIATLSVVYGWIVLQDLVQKENLSPIAANGFSMCIGGCLALMHSRLTEHWSPIPVTDYASFLLWTAYLLVVSNCLGYNLYGYLLKRFSATFLSFAGLLTPLIALFFGWIVHGEVATISFYLSFSCVSVGLFLFYREEVVTKSQLNTI
jgi:drug/metabolite transporter (DMT)-like permease